MFETKKYQLALKDFQSSRQLNKNYSKAWLGEVETYIKLNNKNTFYEIGDVGIGIYKKGTDFHNTKEGYISVTPIMIDMTDIAVYKKLQKLI